MPARHALLAHPLALALLLESSPSRAWTFPEHQRTSAEAIRLIRSGADQARVKRLEAAWRAATPIFARVCSDIDVAEPPTKDGEPTCIPLAALPAFAGDHSCSPEELFDVLESDTWSLSVLETATKAGRKLSRPGVSDNTRINTRHSLNIDLQKDDALYAARARVNGAHFQLSRDAGVSVHVGFAAPVLADYLAQVLRPGALSSATALYVNFHAAAVASARSVSLMHEGSKEWNEGAARVLLEETFALHFLEDGFAAGHFVGSWGDSAYRIGTHDFYCDLGVDTHTWTGKYYDAHGDAFLGDDDLTLTAAAAAASLSQVLDVLGGLDDANVEALVQAHTDHSLNVCDAATVAGGLAPLANDVLLADVVQLEPVPATEHPPMPRFRGELGLFIGASAGAAEAVDVTAPAGSELYAQVRAGLRVGYGFEAITAPSMSNQVFLDVGAVGEQNYFGQAVGVSFRVQVPWAYVPLDGLVALPVAALNQKSAFWVGWAETAGRGPFGLFPRTHQWFDGFSSQLSAGTDFSLQYYPHQRRWELAAPIVSSRFWIPLTGSVTADLLVDLGIEEVEDPAYPSLHQAGFLSISSATRAF